MRVKTYFMMPSFGNGQACLSMSHKPCASNPALVACMQGRKWPSNPVQQFPGISQMRKNPKMWSIL